MSAANPVPTKPLAPGYLSALAVVEPAKARAIVVGVLRRERSVPLAAAFLGISKDTLRRWKREKGWGSAVKVRGRGRPPEAEKKVDPRAL